MKIVGYVLCIFVLLIIFGSSAQSKDTTVAVGQSATVDNWQISISDYTPDATNAIAQENMLNPKPSSGGQWAMVYVNAKNMGKDKNNFNCGNLHLVGASGQVYNVPLFCICPNNFPPGEAFPGASLSGNIAFDVSTQDISSVKLYYKGGWGKGKNYFDLP
ncbi:MAG: DUF4352 domain-containing protein [Methanotrichaceae archaeon]